MSRAREAVRSLSGFGPQAIASLLEILPALKQPRTGYALRVLGEFKHDSAKPSLVAALTDPTTREDAVWALGTMGRIGEPVALTFYLDDPDWRVRVEAARGVGLLGEKDALPALERLRLEDPVIAVRQWAAKGMSLLTGDPVPYRTTEGEWKTPKSLYH